MVRTTASSFYRLAAAGGGQVILTVAGDSRSAGHDTKDGGKDAVIADDDRKLLSTGSRVQVSDLI